MHIMRKSKYEILQFIVQEEIMNLTAISSVRIAIISIRNSEEDVEGDSEDKNRNKIIIGYNVLAIWSYTLFYW